MRITHGVTAAALAATAGLMLTACSADSEGGSDAATGSAASATDIVSAIETATGCEAFGGTWDGGEADDDAAAAWEYTCDADADGTVETTLWVYADAAAATDDLANVEAASDVTAIVAGETFIVATTDSSHLASAANQDGEIVRELPAAE